MGTIAQLRDHDVLLDIRFQHNGGQLFDNLARLQLSAMGRTWGVGDHAPEKLAEHELLPNRRTGAE